MGDLATIALSDSKIAKECLETAAERNGLLSHASTNVAGSP
jgi:hypothetical protein